MSYDPDRLTSYDWQIARRNIGRRAEYERPLGVSPEAPAADGSDDPAAQRAQHRFVDISDATFWDEAVWGESTWGS